MGRPEVAGKSKNPVTNRSSRRRVADQIPDRPASVGREISRPVSSGCCATPCPARVAVWWPVVPLLVQTPTARKWSNGPTWCSRFWRVLHRVLELKMVFWGLGFHLTSKVMFI